MFISFMSNYFRRTYRSMLNRCYNSAMPTFHHYGGRGITVCDRWRNSFESFVDDMGERPEGHSIERNDNSLGYSPDNCRWATQSEQLSNRRYYTKPATSIQYHRNSRLPHKVVIRLHPTKRHTRSFVNLPDAQLYRDEVVYEREFHRALGLWG